MDVEPILKDFGFQKSIKIAINFKIDVWIRLKCVFGTDDSATADWGSHLVPPYPSLRIPKGIPTGLQFLEPSGPEDQEPGTGDWC